MKMNNNIKEIIERLDEEYFESEQKILTIILENTNNVLTVEDIEHIEKLRNELKRIKDNINYLIEQEEEKEKKGEFVETPKGGEFYKTKNNVYHLLLGVNVNNNSISSDIIFIMKESKEIIGFLEYIDSCYGYDKEHIEKLIIKYEKGML